MFDYYTADEQYLEKYYQLPKVFFEDKNYLKLSNDSKIAYAILKDRFNYSIQNKWVDNQGRIYFIYTNKELEHILNVSNKTVVKIKKELASVQLLSQEKQGMNKANLLYLGKPKLNSQNCYQKNSQSLGNKGSVKFTLPENNLQSLDNKGSVKFTLPENNPQSLNNKGSVKSTHNLYINNLDTLLDTYKDTEKPRINLNQYARDLEDEIDNSGYYSIPKRAEQTLLNFAEDDYAIVEKQIGMIFRAKKEASVKANTSLVIEDFESDFINQTKNISLAIFKDKKSIHKIINYDAYFYKSYVRYFEEQVFKNEQIQERIEKKLPHIPMEY